MSPIAAQTPVTPDLPALKSRADAGDPEALNELGNLYANGRGVARNDGEAIRFYAQAADRNYAPALFNLGMMHELGRGVAADSTKAFAFYRKSAELGFALAQFNVGNMYGRGLGVKIDAFESVLWFRQAAEQGVAEAQFNLGLAYDTGRGVGADAKQARQWYRLAAEQGYPRAQYNLAVLLEEGKGGAKDDPLAARLYLAAAQQGFGPAQNNYGIMVGEGRGGLAADLVEAFAWLSLAVDNGVTPAGRDLVANQLTPAQRTLALQRIAQLRGTPSPAVAASPAPTAPAPANDAALAELRRRVDELEAMNAQLRTENTALSQQAKLATASPDEKVQHLEVENARLNDEVKRSTLALSSLYRELREARAKADAAPAAASNGATVPDRSNEIAALQTRVDALTAANSQLASAAVDPQELQRLRGAAEAAARTQAELAGLRQQLAEATEELGRARAARQTAEQALTAAPATAPVDDTALRQAQDELARVRGDLVASRRETEEIRVQLQALQGNAAVTANQQTKALNDALAKANEAEAFASNLETANANLTAQIDDLKKQAATGGTQRNAVTALQVRVDELSCQLMAAQADNRDLAGQLAQAQAKADASAGASAADEAQEAELTRLRGEVALSQRVQQDLKDQVQTARASLATSSNQNARALNKIWRKPWRPRRTPETWRPRIGACWRRSTL